MASAKCYDGRMLLRHTHTLFTVAEGHTPILDRGGQDGVGKDLATLNGGICPLHLHFCGPFVW